MPITQLEHKDVLQWDAAVSEWKATTVLAGISASTIIAGGTNGQALTSNGASAPKFQGMTTQGDVEYHDGTDRQRLAPGTSGQFLKTQGASANPVWANAGSISVLKLDWANTNLSPSQAETTMKSYTLPGGTMGANDGLRITLNYNGGTGSILRVKCGGTTVITDNNVTSTDNRMVYEFYNRNSTSVNVHLFHGMRLANPANFTDSVAGATNDTIDTASDVAFVVTGETDGTGALDLKGWTIEHIKT